ncbi:hypothetical protein [Piscinibacter gummiphilus]|uniref:Uncharacterized protein n=1 Tax=Piscinibacter gummiphilus TaxID=946333 RepID=A0ABZ0CZ05_9BURK|nr:hypothetical protein [Piscinibacter gummiphilus]WOB08217.1 hypothetical protein RXV79_25360 [Piscinibacter gummiphilus]
MNRIPTLTFALLAAAGLTLAGCNKRDDMPPTGAGPGTTTTTPSDTLPGGTSTTPGGGTTAPGDSGTPGSMSPTTPMPSASAASQ